MFLFKSYSNKNRGSDILDKKSKIAVDEYQRENINLDLLALKICVPLTVGCVLENEHEVLFCITS